MGPNKPKKKAVLQGEDISFQSPSATTAQRKNNLAAFGDYRQKTKAAVTDEERLKLRLLQLRFQINEFLSGQNAEQQFGSFLALYMKCLELNGKTFAQEMNIKPSLLSQYIHNQRDPNESIMMRLEIHSNNNFPATLWYGVLARQKATALKNDVSLRKHEATFVKPRVKVVI